MDSQNPVSSSGTSNPVNPVINPNPVNNPPIEAVGTPPSSQPPIKKSGINFLQNKKFLIPVLTIFLIIGLGGAFFAFKPKTGEIYEQSINRPRNCETPTECDWCTPENQCPNDWCWKGGDGYCNDNPVDQKCCFQAGTEPPPSACTTTCTCFDNGNGGACTACTTCDEDVTINYDVEICTDDSCNGYCPAGRCGDNYGNTKIVPANACVGIANVSANCGQEWQLDVCGNVECRKMGCVICSPSPNPSISPSPFPSFSPSSSPSTSPSPSPSQSPSGTPSPSPSGTMACLDLQIHTVNGQQYHNNIINPGDKLTFACFDTGVPNDELFFRFQYKHSNNPDWELLNQNIAEYQEGWVGYSQPITVISGNYQVQCQVCNEVNNNIICTPWSDLPN